MEKPLVEFSRKDGNAYSILATCQRAGRKAGWTQEKINKVLEEMKSDDYEHLLRTTCKYFEVE